MSSLTETSVVNAAKAWAANIRKNFKLGRLTDFDRNTLLKTLAPYDKRLFQMVEALREVERAAKKKLVKVKK
jgi:hypothetical protein